MRSFGLVVVAVFLVLCSASNREASIPESGLMRQVLELADRDYIVDEAGDFYARDSEIGKRLEWEKGTSVTFEPGVGPNKTRSLCTIPLQDAADGEQQCAEAALK